MALKKQHTWGNDGFCIYCHKIHQTDNNARSTCSDGFTCSVEEDVEHVWYVVVYKIGGTLRFSWKHTMPVSYENAKKQEAEIRQQGYYCFVQNFNVIKEHGLPMSFDELLDMEKTTDTI